MTFSAPWFSVTSPRPARFDGDVRPPATIELRTSDPDLTGSQWAYVVVRARITGATRLPEVRQVRQMLYDGRRAHAVAHCGERRFVIDAPSPARS